MGFQTKLNRDVPVAVEGDFASTNPYHTLLAGEGALKAGEDGVTVGTFAWVDLDTGTATNVAIADAPIGFVGRMNIGVLTQYLVESNMLINKGLGVTLHDGGDFWAKVAQGAEVGHSVYAKDADGTLISGASAPAGATDTGFKVASKQDPVTGLTKITK